MDPVVEHSREMIRVGSRSFAGAARLLSASTRDSVYMLYAWCRHCDDRIDQQDLGRGGPGDASNVEERLHELERETRRALDGEEVEHPAFVALQRVAKRHRIPRAHPLELLHGFAMDVEGRRYATLEESLDYCYHVAGVVGVMMAHVMGVREPATLDRAADLGIALQMTNITRDVLDDAAAGRIYLPERWLAEAGVPAAEIAEPRHRAALAAVVRRFLAEAERYYDSANRGIPRLDLRSAWAIATARGVYRDIGLLVAKRGPHAWDSRTVVGGSRKVWRALLGGAQALTAVGLRRRLPEPPREGLWNRPQA
jgi:phytoene synthase